jgi:predicted nucleotidyltransferase
MTLASGIEVSPENLAAICIRYRIRELAVFGSAARGDMRPGSDVDILVEFESGTHPGLGFFRLEEELSELFGRRVDLGRRSLLKPLVRPSVLRDAVVLYAA